MNRKKQPGYVLVFSLMVIALLVVLATSMMNQSRVHVRYARTILDREKAKMLAWSGVQIAMSQLANMGEEEKKDEKKRDQQKADPKEQAKQTLITLLPVLNNWQTFSLTPKKDGVRGEIKICLMCEEGKIDLNQLIDFEKSKFVNEGSKEKDYKKVMKEVFEKIKKVLGGEDLLKSLEKYLKERKTRFYDPTELLSIEEFKIFEDKIFYEPGSIVRDDRGQVKQTVYLNDIFTLWSFQRELNPWLLSNSLKVLLDLKIKKEDDAQLQDEALKKTLQKFELNLAFPKGWNDLLAPFYGKKFEQLPQEIRKTMTTKFEPSVFSVLSYGTVGGVTQKLFVVLERKKSSQTVSSGKSSTSFEFSAKKFYWL